MVTRPPDEDAGEAQVPHALRLPVVSLSAEYLVMGHLLRRNILTYKAPPGNEGYDLVCIHPNPRHRPNTGEAAQVRVQVKSRYQTDCDRGFPLKEVSIDAFDFLVVAFLNIGKFFGRNDGSTGQADVEFFTLSPSFIRTHHDPRSSWQKVRLRGLDDELAQFKNEAGFEQIAKALGVVKPTRVRELPAQPGGGGARWPREIALPGLPRTRTCGFPASGSSGHGFAER